jgi:hypothetical protein
MGSWTSSSRLRDHPLSGPKAFKTAVQEAGFHLGEHSEVVAEIEQTPVMESLKKIQEQAHWRPEHRELRLTKLASEGNAYYRQAFEITDSQHACLPNETDSCHLDRRARCSA